MYDAIYRLIEAQGREHIGLLARPELDWDDSPRMNQPLPGDGQAMRRYKEAYQYDVIGNILAVLHHAADGGWRRHYDYSPSSNRLEHTMVGELEERYSYDADGNMVRMPHLPLMEWDFKNQMHITREQVVNRGEGQRTFYVYDSAGMRVRKVTERPDGSKAHERIYLGGFEIYREYSRNKVVLERETLHVMDDKRYIALVETKTIDSEAQPDSLPSVLIRYQFTNHLDSSCLELDGDAAIMSYEEYYPYGSTSYESVRREVEISPKRYRFTGQERDEETGLYYHGARYYVPWLARWTAADPKGLKDGPNLFVYCSDNPIGLRDPNGTDGEISTTPAENEAQACLVDPSTPVPTDAEEAAQASLPSAQTQANADASSSRTESTWQGPVGATVGLIGADLANSGIVREIDNAKKAAIAADAAQKFEELGENITEAAAKDIAEAAFEARQAARAASQADMAPIGFTTSKAFETSGRTFAGEVAKQEARGLSGIDAYKGVATSSGVGNEAATTLSQVAKVAGPVLAVGGGVLSAYALSQDIKRGDVAGGVSDAAGVVSSGLTLTAVAAGSGTALGAGAAAAAPVVGAFGVGVAVGTYINNNTGISDTAAKAGEWVEAHTGGSMIAGATAAALTSIGTSPYYAAVAAGGALESAGNWLGATTYNLLH